MAGSTHDARVLSAAISDDPLFHVPPDSKYYLVDSGYANKRGYLAPYRREHREAQDIISNNFLTVNLFETVKKCIIGGMCHYVLLLNERSAYGKKNGGS